MIVMRPGTLGTILGQKSQDTLNSAHYTFIKVIHRKLITKTCTTSSHLGQGHIRHLQSDGDDHDTLNGPEDFTGFSPSQFLDDPG